MAKRVQCLGVVFSHSSSCRRVHLKTCKGVAPATVSISRKQKPGATLLAWAKRVQAINVAFAASEAARAVRSEFTLPGTTAMRRTHGKSTPPPPASMPAIPEDVRTTSTQAYVHLLVRRAHLDSTILSSSAPQWKLSQRLSRGRVCATNTCMCSERGSPSASRGN